MPTVAENREKWTVHDWEREGHEWSPGGTRAGTDMLWWRTIMPRLHGLLPVGTLLEIAPGFGRWTDYLLGHSARLIAVDVTERCVEICRERFSGQPMAEFHLNDCESLPMVEPESIDLAFSFDSLVHVEAPQIAAYLRELSRVLKPGAHGFIHHSNLGAYSRGSSGAMPPWLTQRHWRAASVSAAGFRAACRAAGLRCVSQEIINWLGRGAKPDPQRPPATRIPLTDCISVVVKPTDSLTTDPPTRVHINRRFADEWLEVLVMASLYGDGPEVRALPRQGGVRASDVASRIGRALAAPIQLRRYASKRKAALIYERSEGIAGAVLSGACPDCGSRLSQDAWPRCGRCNAAFTLT